MNSRSILVVSSKYPPEYAGSGLRAHRTYLRLRDRFGIRFQVITNGLTHRKSRTYTLDGVEVHRIAGPFGGNNADFLRRGRILGDAIVEWSCTEHLLWRMKGHFDLLHTFGNSWSVAAATFAFHRQKLPIVREVVNDIADPYYPIQFRQSVRRVFDSQAAVMIAISTRLQRRFKADGVPDCRYRLNPVDEERFCAPSDNERLRLRSRYTRFSPQDRVLVQVANYTRNKNHRFAVEVLSRLPDDYKLVLAGPLRDLERDTFDEVVATVKRLGLQDRVQIESGFVENIEDYMRLADVFLFPSKKEGLGTPILEAQACARPVVATEIPGVTEEILMPGRGGYVAPLDASIWAEQIQHAMEIPAETLKENALGLLSRASTSTVDRWYMDLLDELTA